MLDNSVIIKGEKNGIVVVLDKELEFEKLLEKVREKFKDSSKFFGNANMAVKFEGRILSEEECNKILKVIDEESELNIVCLLDNNNELESIFDEAVKKALSTGDDSQNHMDNSCQFYKGTIRSGMIFESNNNVIVLGDVNPGGKIVAKGNVIVLGSLRGNIFAGACGNENAFVVALDMEPMQIKIGDVIARSSDSGIKLNTGKGKKQQIKSFEPKIAYVYDGSIYIENLDQTALNDINIEE